MEALRLFAFYWLLLVAQVGFAAGLKCVQCHNDCQTNKPAAIPCQGGNFTSCGKLVYEIGDMEVVFRFCSNETPTEETQEGQCVFGNTSLNKTSKCLYLCKGDGCNSGSRLVAVWTTPLALAVLLTFVSARLLRSTLYPFSAW